LWTSILHTPTSILPQFLVLQFARFVQSTHHVMDYALHRGFTLFDRNKPEQDCLIRERFYCLAVHGRLLVIVGETSAVATIEGV
jgi:hypothetical protein